MQRFDIYFRAELLPGTDPAAARAAIARLFRMEDDKLDRLFSGKPKRIKRDVDVDKASRYRALFRDFGALIDVVPAGSPPPPAREAARTPPKTEAEPRQAPPAPEAPSAVPAGDFELLPPRTGSLADCAPEIAPRPIADIDWMALDEPGVTLEERPPQPKLEFDFEGLSVSEPGSLTLEDCDYRPQPVPVPDISHLSLVEPERDTAGG